MSGFVYTKRFAGPLLVPATAITSILTVPAGRVWVLRTITIVNLDVAVNVIARLSIGQFGSEGRIYKRLMTPEEAFYGDLRVPLVAGEQAWVQMGVANKIVVSLSGYDFAA